MQPEEVLLDVDGVLCDFIPPCLDIIYELTGQRFTNDEFDMWDVIAHLRQRLGHQVMNAVAHRIKAEGFCLSLPLLPGAQEGVEKLRSVAGRLHIVTSPWDGPHWEAERVEWLRKHFGFKRRDIIQTHSKDIIDGDIIIDDKITTLKKWVDRRPHKHAVLWHTPHNRFDADPRIQRHANWDQLIETYFGRQ